MAPASRWTFIPILIVFNCLVHSVLPQNCDIRFITAPPERLVISEGEDASLFCDFDGYFVNWYKGSTAISGQELSDSCSCAVQTELSGVRINFTDFSAASAGTYGCWASTAPGEFTACNFQVIVAVAPTVELPDLMVVVDDTLVITPTVITLGVPEANIMWSKNGVSLDPDSNLINNVTGVLTMTGFGSEDRGDYAITLHNQAGPASDTIPVTTYFGEVSVSSSQRPDGDYALVCTGIGYPSAPIQWVHLDSDTPLDIDTLRVYEVTSTSDIIIPAAECRTQYTCRFDLAVDGRTFVRSMSTNPCSQVTPTPPTIVAVRPEGNDGVMVTWQPVTAGAEGYRVQYFIDGMEMEAGFMDYDSSATSGLISSLAPGDYRFRVGTLREGIAVYSEFHTVTIACSDDTVPTQKVSNVSAALNSSGGRRTISVSWNSLQGVYGYRLSIFPPPSPPPPIFTNTNSPSYTLPTDLCDGTRYNFTIEVINNCQMGGPAVSVQQICSPFTAVGVTLDVINAHQTHLELNIGLSDPTSTPDPNTIINVNVTNLIPFPDGREIITSMYQIMSYPTSTNGNICIQGLMGATMYNVCIDTAFLNGEQSNMVICKSILTATSGGLSPDDQCQTPVNVISETIGSATFPEWAIAVIVVGLLAIVAFVFCFIGLFFACNSGKSKENIYGSASSLQASSIPPGMGMQTHHIQNHSRDVSPPGRSCLSYHTKGHSTNWNEHRDTLRQMDTDKGTHV